MAPTSSDLKQWVSHWSSAAGGTRPGTSLPSRTSGDRKEREVIILALGLLCHLSCSYFLAGTAKGESWPQEPPGPVLAPEPPSLSTVRLAVSLMRQAPATNLRGPWLHSYRGLGLYLRVADREPSTSGIPRQSIQMRAWSVQLQLWQPLLLSLPVLDPAGLVSHCSDCLFFR